jgi:hypothetical protein
VYKTLCFLTHGSLTFQRDAPAKHAQGYQKEKSQVLPRLLCKDSVHLRVGNSVNISQLFVAFPR